MDVQLIIVICIVAMAAFFFIQRVIATLRKDHSDCGCGCGKQCDKRHISRMKTN